jgi:hypothetical protein
LIEEAEDRHMDCNQADTAVVQVAVGTVELDIAGTVVEEDTAVAAA